MSLYTSITRQLSAMDKGFRPFGLERSYTAHFIYMYMHVQSNIISWEMHCKDGWEVVAHKISCVVCVCVCVCLRVCVCVCVHARYLTSTLSAPSGVTTKAGAKP